MPNQPAVPLVTPRSQSVPTSLPVHEQAARRRRRAAETPRTGTARPKVGSRPAPKPQPSLNPFPTAGPDWRSHPVSTF